MNFTPIFDELDKHICFLFLENGEFLRKLNFENQQLVFGQKLSDFLYLKNSNMNRMELNISTIFSIAKAMSEKTVIVLPPNLNEYSTNNTIKAYFFTLTTFESFENLKIFHLWEFSTHNVSFLDENWITKCEQTRPYCCINNLLNLQILDSLEELNTFADPKQFLNSFCIFPTSFVDVKAAVYSHLLQPELEITKKDLNSLKPQYPNLITNGYVGGYPCNIKFIHTPFFETNDDFVTDFVPNLTNNTQNNFFTPNCSNFFTSIAPGSENFHKFIYNCLLTSYITQHLVVDKNQNKPNMKSFLLGCYLYFN